ncbi:hypothetical protein ACKKBG_A20695 [Auxenochlorella protothecoides x Auxenochlorella symbiontica]|uniref:Uncharacterized protein n=1 Tax=Auxenochlorella protothecoides TaxID=3075 RepID=A0A087SKF2_AUXPR|nr:hypothetical protein F751_4699 [Auxenochlorella protothecoides]KFM26206.1 hypothetical protein F751_4699 [Auxenochlorella protothecoides]RMZ56763.1 hypothetical protein APUTEX25_002852 [Auxenochlorella protothecoides]|eukprot:RMZ56763.1 hypothetical protein APUTEX25_002852 [Auxenochlorella protothecoides]
MSGLSLRQRAAEGMYFAGEERLAITRYLERLVEQGKVDQSVLDRVRMADEAGPTLVKGRSEYVFDYTPGVSRPPPRASHMTHFQLGTQVSFGRSRWSSDNTSIFSVADGKRMAATPPKPLNNYEVIRHAKIQRAALESPQVAGLRLLPEFTPGRAFFWGSVLALWGTLALAVGAARHLEIGNAEEAAPRLRGVVAPLVGAAREGLAPLRDSLALAAGREMGADAQQSVLSQRLRTLLGARQHQ